MKINACCKPHYQVLRTIEINKTKLLIVFLLVNQIYNEKSMYVYRKINPQAELAWLVVYIALRA